MKVLITKSISDVIGGNTKVGLVADLKEEKLWFDNDFYHKSHFEFTEVVEKYEPLKQITNNKSSFMKDFSNESERVFESGSKRDNDDDKPLVNHFDAYCRLRFGVLLRKGANHYGKNNWRLGQPNETAIESLNRHLALYELGDRSEDHLSAIIFNVQLIMKNEEEEGITYNYFK